MSSKNTQLNKALTLSHTVGLAITMVIGGGFLVLPGLVYQQTGSSAIYVWLLDSLLIIPLLAIVAKLGAKHPSAGGVAGFMHTVFLDWGMATEFLLIGTMGVAIPAIALIAGQYFAILLNNDDIAFECAVILLLTATVINWYGVTVSAYIQRILAFALCSILLAVALTALIFGDHTQGIKLAPMLSPETWADALPATALVFFAFTGWEELPAISEEYQNPKRDFRYLSQLVLLLLPYCIY